LSSATDDEPQLTLEAVSDEGTLLLERRKSFGPGGGTIGRSPTSDWVLKDEFVSRQHARITYSGGRFFIEDTNSTAGVSLNDRRLVSGQPHALGVRDRLFIKPYAIEVVASASSRAFSPADREQPVPARKSTPLDDSSVDPLKTHLPTRGATQLPPPSHDLDQWDLDPLLRGLLDESVAIPAPRSQSAATRETSADIDRGRPVESAKVPVSPTPPTVPPQNVAPSNATDLDRLLAGAGLDATRVTPEVAQQLGEVVRTVVDGLLDVLAVRQKARDEFRIQGTMFRPRGNNPLKFSTDVEDALHNLFVKRGAGYLGPVDAFEDAFNDLRHHQLAVVVGMKKAFEAVLEKFKPANLQRRFDQTSKGGKRMGLLQGTPNYWVLYGEWFEGLLKDPDGSFRDLYGEVFGRAYEEELKRLRAQLRPTEPRRKE
jgi:type VI secretion system protein ImpI